MNEKELLQFLAEAEAEAERAAEMEILSGYAPPYGRTQNENIRKRFYQAQKEQARSEQSRNTRKKPKHTKLWVAVVAILVGTSMVWASGLNMQTLYQMFFGRGAEYLNEHEVFVDKSVIKDGIEVKALTAIHGEEMMYLFFSVKDLQGARLHEEIDLNWEITGAREWGAQLLHFDEASQEAVFVGKIRTFSGAGEIEFHIESIELSQELEQPVLCEIDLYDIMKDKDLTLCFQDPQNGIEEYGYRLQDEKIPIPGLADSFIIEIGYMPDKAHLWFMVKHEGSMAETEIGEWRISDQQGQTMEDMEVFFLQQKMEPDLEEHWQTVNFYGVTSLQQMAGTRLEYQKIRREISWGDWTITFPLPKQAAQIPLEMSEVEIDGTAYPVEKAVLTPVGVTVRFSVGNENVLPDETGIMAVVTYKDGRKEHLTDPYVTRAVWTDGKSQVLHITGNVVDLNSVVEVEINGKVITFRK